MPKVNPEMPKVGVGASMKLNVGNYQSVEIQVYIERPYEDTKDIRKTIGICYDQIDAELTQRVMSVKQSFMQASGQSEDDPQ